MIERQIDRQRIPLPKSSQGLGQSANILHIILPKADQPNSKINSWLKHRPKPNSQYFDDKDLIHTHKRSFSSSNTDFTTNITTLYLRNSFEVRQISDDIVLQRIQPWKNIYIKVPFQFSCIKQSLCLRLCQHDRFMNVPCRAVY